MIKSSRSKKNAIFFYAVSSGRTVGIFDNWTDTSKSVNGFSNNQHCKYDTLEKAVEAMRVVGIHDPNVYFAFHENPTPYSKLAVRTEDNNVSQHSAIIDQIGPLNVDTSEVYKNRCETNLSQTSIFAESMNLDYHTPEYQISEGKSEETFAKSIDSQPALSNLDKVDHEISFKHNRMNTKDALNYADADIEDLNPELRKIVNSEILHQVTRQQNMILQQQEKHQLEQERIEEKLDTVIMEQKHCDCCIENPNSNTVIQLLKDIQYQQTQASQHYIQEMKNLKEELGHMNDKFACLLTKNNELSTKLESALTSLEDSKAKETMLQHLLKTTTNNNTKLQNISDVLDDQTNKIETFSKSYYMSSHTTSSSILQSNRNESPPVLTTNSNANSNMNLGKTESFVEINNCLKSLQMDKATDNEDLQGHIITQPLNKTSTPQQGQYPSSSSTGGRTPFLATSMIDDNDIEELETEFLSKNSPVKSKKFNLNQKIDQETVHKNSIRISHACKNLLIGDSNMKNVIRRRLDHTGSTEIRTFRGATVKTLTSIFEKNQHPLPQVEKVIICVGTNDCSRQSVDGQRILDDMHKLIVTTKKVFCSAEICIMAIPPQRNPAVNRYIFKVNKGLKNEAIKQGITFKACHSLWHYHVAADGVVDDGILHDKVHLSSFGLSLLLKQVTHFFFGSQMNQRVSQSMKLKDESPRAANDFEQFGNSPTTSESKEELSCNHENDSSIPKMFSKLKRSYLNLLKRYVH